MTSEGDYSADESHPTFSADSIAALQEATVAYLDRLFRGTILCTIHVKMVTITPKDIQLVKHICGQTT